MENANKNETALTTFKIQKALSEMSMIPILPLMVCQVKLTKRDCIKDKKNKNPKGTENPTMNLILLLMI